MTTTSITTETHARQIHTEVEVLLTGTVAIRMYCGPDQIANILTGQREARSLQSQIAQALLAQDQRAAAEASRAALADQVLTDTGDVHEANMARHYGGAVLEQLGDAA